MIAKITPLIRLPASADAFDYFVPDELRHRVKAGALVSIPFRSSKVLGAVLGLSKTQESTRFRARPIDSIIEEEPALTAAQLRLIGEFSRYYFVTPGSVARMMVPDRPERVSGSKPPQYPDIRFSVSPAQLPKLKQAAQSLLQPSSWREAYPPTDRISSGVDGDSIAASTRLQNDDKKILQIQDVSSFVWLLLYLMTHSKQSQLLVLVPTIEMISAIAGSVQKKCSDKLAVIHSGLSKGAYWSEYQKILSARARIILSTRQGVFLPIQRNSQIIFFDSTSEDFKQYDQRPRYDARIVGTWLANVTQSKLLFASSSPSFWSGAERSDRILPVNREDPIAPSTGLQDDESALPSARSHRMRLSLVDMKNEMQRKDFSIIAGQTLDAIKETLAQNKRVMVIALREEPPLNPPLGKGGKPRGGVSVKAVFEVLTRELKNCKVRRSSDDFDVLVTTPGTLEGLKLSSERRNIGLLIFASIEPLLAIPDYRSGERAYYRLKHWHMLAQELGFERIILQSYSPDSAAVRAFAYGEFEAFKNEELKNRKALGYPPFSKLIKLSQSRHAEPCPEYSRGIDSASSQEQILKQVQDDVRAQNDGQAIGPFMDAHKRLSLLIKLSHDAKLPDLSGLGPDWIIDRDPENVL